MSENSTAASLYDADNPLINPPTLPYDAPALGSVRTEHYMPAIGWAIAKAKEEIALIRDNLDPATFENTVEALSFAGDDRERVALVFENITASNSSDALREIEATAKKEQIAFANDLMMDAALFARVKAVYDRREKLNLTEEQDALLNHMHKEFIRSGVHLEEAQKARLKEIRMKLSEIGTQFENNDVKASEAFKRVVTDEAELDGVPERAKNIYRQQAKEAGYTNGEFLLLLQPYPFEVARYCKNRALREEMHKAAFMACYKDGFDNTSLMTEMIKLRHEEAQLLGYKTYADYVLSDRMAGSLDAVKTFLDKNLAIYRPSAEPETQALKDLAAKDGIADFSLWDQGYYTRMLEEAKFDLQDEDVRPYFDLEKTMEGVRRHAEKLFDIELREEKTGRYPTYHPDVKTYEVYDNKTGFLIGLFYGDFYARAGSKNDGAWMNVFRSRSQKGNESRVPIVINNCNFTKPTPEQPTLLSIDEVKTVFHEFGHGLHALLAEGRYGEINGINVKWDFVEVPSQLMENWVTEPQVLASFARHYKTGEVIPAAMIEKIKERENFNAGITGLRQTYLGMLDLAFNGVDPATIESVEKAEKAVVDRTLLVKPAYGMQSTTFTHIFSGGYAAGYYGYKWAEMLEADIFEAFKRKGLYDADLGRRLRDTIYSRGATVEPMALYKRMMGRDPDAEALFRREGLSPAAPKGMPASVIIRAEYAAK